MSRVDPQANFRLPAALRDRLKAQAVRNRRSMNAELIVLIESGLQKEHAPLAATGEASMRSEP